MAALAPLCTRMTASVKSPRWSCVADSSVARAWLDRQCARHSWFLAYSMRLRKPVTSDRRPQVVTDGASIADRFGQVGFKNRRLSRPDRRWFAQPSTALRILSRRRRAHRYSVGLVAVHGRVELTELVQLGRRHLRIAVDGLPFKAQPLVASCRLHALPDRPRSALPLHPLR